MLDAGYQFKQNDPAWFDVVRPTKLRSFPNEFAPNGNTYSSVRQSRLGVKSSTPTKYGELKTQFEFELFGTGAQAEQTIFRLRHAYGELGQFGAGQQNTVFMDGDVFPNTIEYWGPNGMVLFRNVQFRWMPLKGRNALTIALQRPGASADQGRFEDRIELQGVRGQFNLPDPTANFRWTRGWGHFQVAGLLKRMARIGFALIAFPAQYRLTGVQTFMVSHDGVVYQKDLGPKTLELAGAINRFNPDKSWTPVLEK